MKQFSERERDAILKVCTTFQNNLRYDNEEKEYFASWDELSINISTSEYKNLDSAVRKMSPKKIKFWKKLKGVAL